jgi:hypothetical protein
MKIKFVVTILLLGLSPLARPGESINRLMKSQFTSARFDSDEDFNIQPVGHSNEAKYKSNTRAALYSLILPGAGQYYVNKGFKAKMFFGIESVLWFSYAGFRKFGSYKDDASKGWAVLHAGANPDNTDNRYWVALTYYDNRDRNEPDGFGFNQMAAVYDREEAPLFPETRLYYWNWENAEVRKKYRSLRNQSKTAYERADITVGMIIANHLLSAIEAYFSATRHNRGLEFSESGFKIQYALGQDPANPSIALALVRSF